MSFESDDGDVEESDMRTKVANLQDRVVELETELEQEQNQGTYGTQVHPPLLFSGSQRLFQLNCGRVLVHDGGWHDSV